MSKILVNNRKAYYEFKVIEKIVAGIELRGSEVKSIKTGDVNINEAYCNINDDEIFIKNMHVSEHKQGGVHNNHEPFRVRKLLLKKKEIINLRDKVKQRGLSIIPLTIFLTNTNLIKLEVALVKGKKIYDKRDAIKEKDLKRANGF